MGLAAETVQLRSCGFYQSSGGFTFESYGPEAQAIPLGWVIVDAGCPGQLVDRVEGEGVVVILLWKWK